MSFTIKCNKCGNEQEFKNESHKHQDKISFEVYVRGTYSGVITDSIDIECENITCNNTIEIKL